MSHTHADEQRLTFGCHGCIMRRNYDQVVAMLPELATHELIDIIDHGTAPHGVHVDEALGDAAQCELDRRMMDSFAEFG